MGSIRVNGIAVEGVPPIMPPHGFMKDDQLADILTYVRNAGAIRRMRFHQMTSLVTDKTKQSE